MEQKFRAKLIDDWVRFWNTFDLNQVENIFLKDDRVTYFSSEKEGLIKGYKELVKHHEGFGFVRGGKPLLSMLWLEEIDVQDFGDSAIVSAIWFFKRPDSKDPQRGPVTLVFERTNVGWRIAHANFSNYK